jgi:hypothetical protein
VTTTMVPEMVPEKIAPSNLKALGLEISMAPAPGRGGDKCQRSVGRGWEYAERAATRNAGYSSEAGGGATAN